MKHARWVLVAALMAGVACGGDGGDGGTGGGESGGTPTDTVTMVDNAFEPSDPVVEEGSTVTVVNEGEATHTFTIQDEGVDELVEAGAEASVEITLAAGDYDFICSLHPEMTGTLTIQ